jgi:molybdopterin molybdotransferase
MSGLLTVEQADERIRREMADFGTEEIALSETAGRVLRQRVCAERDLPPFDRVMMDGIALRYATWAQGERSFRAEGIAAAGSPQMALESRAGCIEVMTGAVMPKGCDCVVPVERIDMTGGMAEIHGDYTPTEGQFIHRQGSDHTGQATLLEPGIRLGGPETAVVAAAGLRTVRVAKLPRIAVVSVGDELVEPGHPIQPHQVRRSNDYAIEVAIRARAAGVTTRVSVEDDEAKMISVIGERLEDSDVLVLSGGVSMGKYDFVPVVLEALGIGLVFHKVSQRPGRPMWFGRSADGKPVFALPGNPVSATVCLSRYVLPGLERAMGMAADRSGFARLDGAVRFEPDLTCFLPVNLRLTDDAALLATPTTPNTSGDFAALAGTDGVVELPRGRDVFPAGFVARYWPW